MYMDEILTTEIPRSVWWGWGDHAVDRNVPDHLWPLLDEEFGIRPRERRPDIELDQVDLPDSRLPQTAAKSLAQIVGEEDLRTSRLERVMHASGKSYIDQFRLRTGDGRHAPDGVIYPESEAEILEIMQVCLKEDLALVPFGGGTSVVGGLDMLTGGKKAVLAVDMCRFNQLVAIDKVSQLATLGAGMRGPEMEQALQAHGFTAGHYPQSHQEATVGGYAVTRSAGQASTGYGRLDSNVRGLRLVTPQGVLVLDSHSPSNASGPKLRELLLGSEGVFGIVTEVTLQVVPLPTAKEYACWVFPNWEVATKAFRRLHQHLGKGIVPDVCRLSDEEESRDLLVLSGSTGDKLAKYLKLRGLERPCIGIFLWEGRHAKLLKQRRSWCEKVFAAHGGKRLPSLVAKKWEQGRFQGPYLRDAFMNVGVLAETLETAANWSNLLPTYYAVQKAIKDTAAAHGLKALVQCHISHLYHTGASLYYTFVMQESDDPVALWHEIKRNAGNAIEQAGASITHHHGVGTAHRPNVAPDMGGDLGVRILQAVKEELDPQGILNPEKLIPNVKSAGK